MTKHICETCGTQHADSDQPPAHCAVCEDERQYVGWTGQSWTTHDTLGETHAQRIEDEDGSPALA